MQAVAPVVAMKELRAQGVQVVLPSTEKDPATHGTGSAFCPAHELPARHSTPAAVEVDAGQKLPAGTLQEGHETAFAVSLYDPAGHGEQVLPVTYWPATHDVPPLHATQVVAPAVGAHMPVAHGLHAPALAVSL